VNLLITGSNPVVQPNIMAISLTQYEKIKAESVTHWEEQLPKLEKEIDDVLLHSISENTIPDNKFPNFVARYKFNYKVPTEVKNLLRVKYGELGWVIKENVDFKDFNVHGYIDFYKKEVK
jgi:hypothetical protein